MMVGRTPHMGQKRLNPLIDFARKEGWAVFHTPDGHLTFTKPGLPPIYAGPVTGNHRGCGSTAAQPRRDEQTSSPRPIASEAGSDG